ncbi:MAG: cobyrinic acid a,c-diamide synthase [Desulfobacterales bacterium]|nr:MAG: cobyrinic acid a,c-diamide synthase [Desulfobacterales bacterium]
MTVQVPAVVVSGTASGCGKTTVALGLMAALRQRGLQVQAYKCGPDFIDPGLHRLATGKTAHNLDLWMAGERATRDCFYKNLSGSDAAVIEGVMGMFDGGLSSSGELSRRLHIATILVLDVRSTAESAAAIVKGFETYRQGATICGVILNNIASPRHLQLTAEAIRLNCNAEVLGFLPKQLDFSIPSRHLGLLTADEAPLSPQALSLLAETIEQHVDLDRLLKLATQCTAKRARQTIEPRCRIAVARDKAFCFYYQDNFDILRAAGAEIVFFSPLQDPGLPENIDGIYLGGGYPELYAEQLSQNLDMLEDIRQWAAEDRVMYAECGGFMYLTEGIVDTEGTHHRLAGIFPATATMQKKRAGLGYREVTTTCATCFGPAQTTMRGHEFHYSRIDETANRLNTAYQIAGGAVEGYIYNRTLGGYIHLHWGFSPQVAEAFINACLE